ncbi:MAG: hypothetical protein IJI75_13670 [Solobacterium sp.]|nr:hypothetical protein [Solobacterium sp.]
MTDKYTDEIAEALKRVMDARTWNYVYSSEFNDFRFVTAPDCGILKYVSYYISIDESVYTVYASFPLGICREEYDRHHLASKYLHVLNGALKSTPGTWMIDPDGTITYKYFVGCSREVSPETIEESLDYPAAMLQKFAETLVRIIMDPDPAETLCCIERIGRFIEPGDLIGELTAMEACIAGSRPDHPEFPGSQVKEAADAHEIEHERDKNDEHQG